MYRSCVTCEQHRESCECTLASTVSCLRMRSLRRRKSRSQSNLSLNPNLNLSLNQNENQNQNIPSLITRSLNPSLSLNLSLSLNPNPSLSLSLKKSLKKSYRECVITTYVRALKGIFATAAPTCRRSPVKLATCMLVVSHPRVCPSQTNQRDAASATSTGRSDAGLLSVVSMASVSLYAAS